MSNSSLFLFAVIPAILYKRSSLRKLYETYVKLGMSFQEVARAIRIKPVLVTAAHQETSDELVEIFECNKNNTPEKFIMVFINGKLNEWYTEFKQSMEK
ncbi:MAG: hypothetical protein E6772_02125 [Dysgonomonas sp.]|nr:hypothetical protein [Dysgonomonas sp.]